MAKFFVQVSLFAIVLLVTACGSALSSTATPLAQPVPLISPTPAPQLTAVPATAASTELPPTPAPTLVPTAPAPPSVPRNRTLVFGWPLSDAIGVTNPWAGPAYSSQEGNSLLWEGLAYYGVFTDKEIPWLARSMEYTKPDFTELTIRLNEQAAWSDGVPLTARDVVYTFERYKQNDTLPYHSDFQNVQEIQAPDDHTVILKFSSPAPRFKFEVLTFKFDTGIPILPEHVLSKQSDVTTFNGGLDIPHSGPYNIVAWNLDQKTFDLRPDWWAVKAGLVPKPAVERVVFLSIANQSNDMRALRMVNNEYDSTYDMRGAVISSILKQNPKITTFSGAAPPYGYLDWWPNALWMNTLLPPYDDARVRRAMSLAIDRDTLDELLYEGAPIATIYPFPLYPGLEKFANSAQFKALEAQYNPRAFNLDESARLMSEAGYTKNSDGLWEKDGEVVDATINGFEGIHGDIVPVLVEMLKRGGFNASAYFGVDSYQNMSDGKAGLYMFGQGGSLRDPYAALELFHGRHSAPTGTPAGAFFSRYNNPEYDAILDQMAMLGSDDPKFQDLAAQALEIYWREQIDIPVIQWLHRIPYNTTYWENWPTQANPGMGVSGAFWHQTAPLVIINLQPAQ